MKITHFATTNQNKLREINQILGIELIQIKLDLLEPQALDVEDVVKTKAIEAYQQAGFPVLVEDTSLSLTAWNGLPGALIKWFLETVGPQGVVNMLGSEQNREAIAKTAVAYHDGQSTHVFTGHIQGGVITGEVESGGFGWDGLFIPSGFKQTFATISSEQKNTISMRKLALDKLRDHLDSTNDT